MVIAVNTKITGSSDPDENNNFIVEAFTRLISSHPRHTFVLISDKNISESFAAFSNVTFVATRLQKKNTVQWYLWYNMKLPAILKKYHADILISYGSIGCMNTKVPQCLIIPNLDFLFQPRLFTKTHLLFYKRFVPRSIKKARVIITASEFCKAAIIKQFKVSDEKIDVVYNGVNEKFSNIDYDEKEQLKTKYSEGHEYFIYTGEIASHRNLLNLLKAFSAFKKRQKSGMKLFVAGKQITEREKFYEDLRLFRFKDDVKLFENPSLEHLTKLTAAAYAMVYPATNESFPAEPLQAMRSGVPVVATSGGVMPEILDDAALFASGDNFKEIAVQMMTLFRDETLRQKLIDKGKLQAEKYDWNITSDRLWKVIEEMQ